MSKITTLYEGERPKLHTGRLKSAMTVEGLSVTKLSAATGISKGTISQYTHGRIQPSAASLQRLADALNVTVGYLTNSDETEPDAPGEDFGNNMPVNVAARLMNKSKEFVYKGLQEGVFPFGYAIQVQNRWTYFISPYKFTECTGIPVPGRTEAGA